MSNRIPTDQYMAVANEIKRQLGPHFPIMTGAKDWLGTADGEGSLVFSLPRNGFNAKRINKVRVMLCADDTYTVTFWKIRGAKVTVIAEVSDVYCDNLREVFTAETNLMTSLSR